MQIRLMEIRDIPKVSQIEKETFSIPWSEQAFQEALEKEYTLFLIAEEKNQVKGYIGIYLAADEGEITNVAVGENFRRHHIGEHLVRKAMSEAVKKGAASIFLEVRCSNTPAIALYEKMGFSICGTRKGFYEKPKEDAYVMVSTPDISTVQAGR